MSWLRNLLASFFGSKRKQSASLSLNEVVIAMNDVVRESRRIFEQDFPRQLSNRFFNKDGTPISKRFQFQELDGSWKSLDVPLISLIPADPLQIRRVTFEFEANVIVEPTEDKRTTRKDLEIVIGGKPKAAHTPVNIKVRFGGPSEGPSEVQVSYADGLLSQTRSSLGEEELALGTGQANYK